ncbi:phosphoribosylformylglycinamidine cyclo-ligase [Halonatronum saccharophilum]|uniref:phosphoribosylformylglycinamidine cyclo-ligase n=1 Tax=Halonatronum saccharophilum TaxID=150060 RepID=UPI000485D386|nr:phosphoribosylformylglycinamidine cyclo-ligase [Halonatronum saccharophilum]
MGLSYKDAGVDIKAGEETVDKISKDVKSTFGPEVLTGLGGFGGLFAPDLKGYKEPVLVSGTDGVGTKLKIAFMMDKHDSVGIDLVAMCVNDILAQGAKPLFFLDYLATGKLDPNKAADIVKGITLGCKQADSALIGGETAEMPDFYDAGEYDLAGFVVGIVDKDKVITGQDIKPGDKVIGLASSGIHSNGYSLARKIFFEVGGYKLEDKVEGLASNLGEELIKPTKVYVKPVLKVLEEYDVKGIAHITGGGIIENIPRVLPEGTKVVVDKSSWEVPDVFKVMQNIGEVEEKEMHRTFNMGIGMTLVVKAEDVDGVMESLKKSGEEAYLIGDVQEGDKLVQFK